MSNIADVKVPCIDYPACPGELDFRAVNIQKGRGVNFLPILEVIEDIAAGCRVCGKRAFLKVDDGHLCLIKAL